VKYPAVLADPPWQYDDKLKMSDVSRGADDHYETMTLREVGDLHFLGDCNEDRIAGYEIADPAILFLWVTNPFLLTGAGSMLCRRWGFEPKQLITWVKTKKQFTGPCTNVTDFDCETTSWNPVTLTDSAMQFGMGHYTRGVTEHIILGTRGRATKLVKAKNIRNAFFAPRTKHSRKPVEQYALIEGLLDGPYLELFARERREGWTQWGKELS
jgi:N6-adenosine-specific RNA methylase IME4